jgi:hypothetical protein
VPFGSLIYEPGNNIWAWPEDAIYLYKEPQTFLAFGASGVQGQFPFTAGAGSSAWRMTRAEAAAAAGGLIDVQADPGSVFLYRREPRASLPRSSGRLLEDGRCERANRLFGKLCRSSRLFPRHQSADA